MATKKNPSGRIRPQNGSGKGTGRGNRQGRNTGGCKIRKIGKSTGKGKGGGRNRLG